MHLGQSILSGFSDNIRLGEAGTPPQLGVALFGTAPWINMLSYENPQFPTGMKVHLLQRMMRILAASEGEPPRLAIRRIFFPDPRGSTVEIIQADDFRKQACLGNMWIHHNPTRPAQGLFLKPSDALMLKVAGCGILAMTDGERVIAAHLGRLPLIRFAGPSIVDTCIDILGVPLNNLRAWVGLTIHPEYYTFDLYDASRAWRSYNLRLYEHLSKHYPPSFTEEQVWWISGNTIHLDLLQVARAQCLARGILSQHITVGPHLPDRSRADGTVVFPTTRTPGRRDESYLAICWHF